MEAFKRIQFHLSKFIRGFWLNLQELINPNFEAELMAEFEEKTNSLSQDAKDKIEQTVREQYEKTDAARPKLNPRRTMLIHSRPEEHGCNSLTAPLYKQKILNALEWARERGITTFLTDYCTPLGLLALETLVELREQGESFHVYAVRSTYFGKRRTYRTIPETPVEMAFLPARADYSYHDPLEDMLTDVLPSAWIQCSEQGIWFARDKIPPYLLAAWRTER